MSGSATRRSSSSLVEKVIISPVYGSIGTACKDVDVVICPVDRTMTTTGTVLGGIISNPVYCEQIKKQLTAQQEESDGAKIETLVVKKLHLKPKGSFRWKWLVLVCFPDQDLLSTVEDKNTVQEDHKICFDNALKNVFDSKSGSKSAKSLAIATAVKVHSERDPAMVTAALLDSLIEFLRANHHKSSTLPIFQVLYKSPHQMPTHSFENLCKKKGKGIQQNRKGTSSSSGAVQTSGFRACHRPADNDDDDDDDLTGDDDKSSQACSLSRHKADEEEENVCLICREETLETIRKSLACKHWLCADCHAECLRRNPVCPVCRKAFAAVRGNQPEAGIMDYKTNPSIHLPGYEKYGTIVITYMIPGGIQTDEHPQPGRPYSGTRRMAYLPDSPDGRSVLSLLRKAFDSRLTFTVGTSLTTGRDNTVVWNDIHHKTSIGGGPQGFGYPDPTYLTRVTEDLAAKGIV